MYIIIIGYPNQRNNIECQFGNNLAKNTKQELRTRDFRQFKTHNTVLTSIIKFSTITDF